MVYSLFNQERRYVVPLFQRPYVWTQDLQLEPLWDDIAARANREVSFPNGNEPPHFLGAIVIQSRKRWNDQLLAHDVIDGQQRLTTLQIIIKAFQDATTNNATSQVANVLRTWTTNDNAIADKEVEQFKIWPTERDVAQFRVVMTAGSPDAVEQRYPRVFKRNTLQARPRMIEAYLFFYERIDEWLKLEGMDRVSERERVLKRVFEQRLELVAIELDEKEDPQAIFETLNSRGVPLLASDLLRNFIFHRAGDQESAKKLYDEYWARFEIPDNPTKPNGLRFWEVEERQGRLNRARLDLFVQHYLGMKFDSEIRSGQLFHVYKTWISAARPFQSVADELLELAVFSDHYLSLIRPDESTALGAFARRLKLLDTSTVYPLVLGLLGNKAMPDEDLHGILADLESFLVRRLVCRRTTKNYNRLFVKLLRDFDALGGASRDVFQSLLLDGDGEAVDWPTDAAFEQAWTTVDAYGALGHDRVHMILSAIEHAMSAGSLSEKVALKDLTVEHVMPQKWRTWWPLPGESTVEIETTIRNELIHDFGNLTLLTQPLNSQVSNGAAEQKLMTIFDKSRLLLNKTFSGRTTWDENDIRERTAALFVHAKKIWPRP